MKAVPKVNIDGLYLEDELVDDTFTGVVPFYSPALPITNEPEHLDTVTNASNPSTVDEPVDREPAGYIVGIPVPPGFFRPRFDLTAWRQYEDSIQAAEAKYQESMSAWNSTPEEERGDRPVLNIPPMPALWIEGLTPEEIERITAPQPQALSELDRLGTELVARELEMLEIRRQNETLGAQVVGLELRLLSLEGNPSEGGETFV
ncbi:hypothetical protein [Paenibacillus lactis]|uniref:Bacteriophage SP-beta YorD domain-containing protein n=1 Tax=Paenibacillus lactis 154 TaxID=743719 RepID=G4HLP7_9BACL|nr:hypothetical protein [Paenibacillus lactis]EHB56973.1 hypothetical protein PaelaDRAFT_4908 [Paenibacillus lactis 154]